MRIKSDVEFTVARLGRSARWRIEILVARSTGCRRIWPTGDAPGTGEQFNRYVNAFACRRIRHHFKGVLMGAVRYWADRGDLWIGAARRLKICRLTAVCVMNDPPVDV